MVAPLLSTVPAAAAGQSLLAWLTARFRYHDAAGWRAAIDQGRVQRNGAAAPADACLVAGDTIGFTPHVTAAAVAAVSLLLDDDDLLAVDKPPHLVVQSATAFPANSLPLAIARQWGEAVAGPLEPVHRLDRETTGVLVFARNRSAAQACQRQFEAAAVHKEYLAVVHGRFAGRELLVEAPIGPAPHSRIAARRAVVAAGSRGAKVARTSFELLQQLDGAALLRAVPHTGRTHQIRVHLEHLGHPLLGDKLYGHGDEHWLAYVDHLKAGGDPRWPGVADCERHLLHAERLGLRHPRHDRALELHAPWPADLCAAVTARGGSAR